MEKDIEHHLWVQSTLLEFKDNLYGTYMHLTILYDINVELYRDNKKKVWVI